MMSNSHTRKTLVFVSLIIGIGCAAGLILFAMTKNLNLFYTPSEVYQTNIKSTQLFRIGGIVEKYSVQPDDGLNVTFKVTDFTNDITVKYNGILPDLFKEGQGVVVVGKLIDKGVFLADEVLAKHDEKYMPPKVKETIDLAKLNNSNNRTQTQ